VKKLTLVTATQPPSDDAVMPSDLAAYGRRLWSEVQSSFAIEDIGGLELLRQCCRAADRAESCRMTIDAQGEVVKLKGGVVKEHPLLRIELQSRAFVTRTLSRLGITDEPVKAVGRPPKLYGGGN
jgi:hypothetical protein